MNFKSTMITKKPFESAMRILLTNDDAWGARGLQTLERVAKKFGEVFVVAPANPQSGISHQLTFEQPVQLVEKAKDSYSLTGTPADCVRIAKTQLGVEFDWVFSGINHGANLGADIYVSGTVAAAREAWLQGIKAISFSQYRNFAIAEPYDWSTSAELCERVIEHLLNDAPQDFGLVNVNFPDTNAAESSDDVNVVHCALDPNSLPTSFVKTEKGLVYNGKYRDRKREVGRDIDVCFSGSVAVTKLH